MGSFTKIDSRKNLINLKEEDLVNKIPFSRICYVVNQGSGISKIEKGFYRLTVKTCDGLSVPAMIFDLKDFINSGLDVAALVGKFIEIQGTTSTWGYSYSIIVDKIFLIDQDCVEDKDLFLGKTEDVDLLLQQCAGAFKNLDNCSVPSIYRIGSYPSIYNGEVGGYVKFIWKWIYQCMVYSNDMGSEFLSTLYYTIIYYGRYLDRVNSSDIITCRDKIDLLKSIPTIEGSSVNSVVFDAMQAILGLGEPEHLFAHVVYNTFKNTQLTATMLSDWRITVMGGASTSKGYVLRKY